MMQDLIRILLPGRHEYLPAIKLAVSSLAATAHFSVDKIDDIQIAVAEASKNISCHGYPGYSRMHEVDCEIKDDKIVIVVMDVSLEHDLEKTQRCLDCPHEGKLGLPIIRSLMDEVEVNKDSTNCRSITMVKYR